MVHELDRAAGDVGNFRPGRSDKLDRGVVVFDDAVRSDKGVNDHQPDFVVLDRGNYRLDDRPSNFAPVFVCSPMMILVSRPVSTNSRPSISAGSILWNSANATMRRCSSSSGSSPFQTHTLQRSSGSTSSQGAAGDDRQCLCHSEGRLTVGALARRFRK